MKVQKSSLELVMVIECVAADGSILKPCLVFPRTTVLHEGYFEEGCCKSMLCHLMQLEAYHDCSIALSELGWMNDLIGVQWFEKCFIPQAKEWNTTGKQVLLIYDGHHSHETFKICDLVDKSNVLLFKIPPPTHTHNTPLTASGHWYIWPSTMCMAKAMSRSHG